MRPLFIAIISLQKENFNKTEELLEEKYFDFSYFSTLEDFQKEKDEKEFDVIVVDDKTFDENIDNKFINTLIFDENIVLYSLFAQYANKKSFFEKGGWMAAVGELADERLFFFLNQMLQFENHLIPSIRKNNLFVGDIVSFSGKEL